MIRCRSTWVGSSIPYPGTVETYTVCMLYPLLNYVTVLHHATNDMTRNAMVWAAP